MNKIVKTDDVKFFLKAIEERPNKVVLRPCVNVKKACRFCVDLITINRGADGHVWLYLSDDADKGYLDIWYKDSGAVLLKAIKKCPENVVEIIYGHMKALCVRLYFPEDYIEEIRKEGLVHLKVGDFEYTIVRVIPDTESFAVPAYYSVYDYTKSEDEEEVDDYKYTEEENEDMPPVMPLFDI
mgnify:FL=1